MLPLPHPNPSHVKLRHTPQTVGAIEREVPVSQPAVWQHLKALELSGLVEAKPRGSARLYRVKPGALAPLHANLDEMWGDVLDTSAQDVHNQVQKTNTSPRDRDN